MGYFTLQYFVCFLNTMCQKIPSKAYVETIWTSNLYSVNLNTIFAPFPKTFPSCYISATNVQKSNLFWNIFPVIVADSSQIKRNLVLNTNVSTVHCSKYFDTVDTPDGIFCHGINLLKFHTSAKPWNFKIHIGIPVSYEFFYSDKISLHYPMDEHEIFLNSLYRSLDLKLETIYILVVNIEAKFIAGNEKLLQWWLVKAIMRLENKAAQVRFFILANTILKQEIIELRRVWSEITSSVVSKLKWASGQYL